MGLLSRLIKVGIAFGAGYSCSILLRGRKPEPSLCPMKEPNYSKLVFNSLMHRVDSPLSSAVIDFNLAIEAGQIHPAFFRVCSMDGETHFERIYLKEHGRGKIK